MGGKAARAILIDDDPEFHETFRKALESVAVETGFPVELACTSGTGMDGHEAEGFDIYFVDIELGQESGIEMASELQRRCSGREFIFKNLKLFVTARMKLIYCLRQTHLAQVVPDIQ